MRIGREINMSILEFFAFSTALIGVVLGVLGPRFTWPWWGLSSFLYAIFFYQSEYYASAALQFIFIAGAFGDGLAGDLKVPNHEN